MSRNQPAATNPKILFLMQHGSHLYGTNTPESDADYKGVVIPPVPEILLGTRPHGSYSKSTKKGSAKKNTKSDTDTELFTLHAFLRSCAEGQTFATELLFAPDQFTIQTTPIWDDIRARKHMLIHKNIKAYFGYARQQAAKYGIKGSRVAAVRAALEFLKQYKPAATLDMIARDLEILADTHRTADGEQWIGFTEVDVKGKPTIHFEVCNRKLAMHTKVGYAISVYQKVFDEYGQRALLAEKNEGIDWKAMSHAVRVGGQAIELLRYGHIILPRPEAPLLLDIKLGKMPYKEVAELIEQRLAEIIEAEKLSALPDSINMTYWEEFVCQTYGQEIVSYVGR